MDSSKRKSQFDNIEVHDTYKKQRTDGIPGSTFYRKRDDVSPDGCKIAVVLLDRVDAAERLQDMTGTTLPRDTTATRSHVRGNETVLTDEESSQSDGDSFCWEKHCELHGGTLAEDAAFKQVEESLHTDIVPGMLVEYVREEAIDTVLEDLMKTFVNEEAWLNIWRVMGCDECRKVSSEPAQKPLCISNLSPNLSSLREEAVAKTTSFVNTVSRCTTSCCSVVLSNCIDTLKNYVSSVNFSADSKAEQNSSIVPVKTYWFARVVAEFGPLLRLEYILPNLRQTTKNETFWVQIGTDALHPLGHGARHRMLPLWPAEVRTDTPGAQGSVFVDTQADATQTNAQDTASLDMQENAKHTQTQKCASLSMQEHTKQTEMEVNALDASRILESPSSSAKAVDDEAAEVVKCRKLPDISKQCESFTEENHLRRVLDILRFLEDSCLSTDETVVSVKAQSLCLESLYMYSKISSGQFLEVICDGEEEVSRVCRVESNCGGRLSLRRLTTDQLGAAVENAVASTAVETEGSGFVLTPPCLTVNREIPMAVSPVL